MKILFILKERFYSNSNIKSYGLINSSKQLAQYFEFLGHKTKLSIVVDGNNVDKEVFDYKPDIVIIEALWVTPNKFKELIEKKRYKNIIWIVRIHSDIGYLAAETMALANIRGYIKLNKRNLIIAPNNKELNKQLSFTMNYKFTYLPNVIVEKNVSRVYNPDDKILNIGCLGALRILKNQLFQAVCAIRAADILGKTLHFHITADENDIKTLENNEEKQNPVLRNLEELFKGGKHKLIKHTWLENKEFQKLISKMDLGLQISYTESFNIVTTDFINHDIPIIVGESIPWVPEELIISTVNYDAVIQKIIDVYNNRNDKDLIKRMQRSLSKYNRSAKQVWFILLFFKVFFNWISQPNHHDHHDHHDNYRL